MKAHQLGFHICLLSPNIEIHVPFGFFRIGWLATWYVDDEMFYAPELGL